MVERLKAAIEKARASRLELDAGSAATRPAPTAPARPAAFEELPLTKPDRRIMIRNHIITRDRVDPNYASFDVLRTRLARACSDNGWSRIGITSPTKGCGKSTVALNLAFSFDRLSGARTLLLDFDLSASTLSRKLGVVGDRRMADFLSGAISPRKAFERLGDNLAAAFNDTVETDPSERLHSSSAADAITAARESFAPTLLLFDLPPVLSGDSMLAASRHLDAVLMVAAAGQTTAAHLEEAAHLIKDHTQILGVAFNRCEDAELSAYEYGYS